MFQFSEMAKVIRQRGDTKFIDLFNKIQVWNVDEDVKTQIRERFIDVSDINYPEKALHMFAENYPTVQQKQP